MEEKERYYLNYLYDIYALTDESLYICDNDNRFGKIETLKEIQNLLNQQDKHIKELERENQQLKQQLEEAENYIEEDEVSKREYYQKVDKNDRFKDKKIKELKQQLHDLPNKIVEEIRKEIEFPLYVHPDFDEFECLFDIDKLLDTILKKFGGEDESLCCNVKQ